MVRPDDGSGWSGRTDSEQALGGSAHLAHFRTELVEHLTPRGLPPCRHELRENSALDVTVVI